MGLPKTTPFSELLRTIRTSRRYYPYDDSAEARRHHYIITPEEYALLSDREKGRTVPITLAFAKHLCKQLTSVPPRHYQRMEIDAGFAADYLELQSVMNLLRCSPTEREQLESLSGAKKPEIAKQARISVTIKETFKRYRKKKRDISQEQIAIEANCNKNEISLIETGKISYLRFTEIIAALGFASVDEFCEAERNMVAPPPPLVHTGPRSGKKITEEEASSFKLWRIKQTLLPDTIAQRAGCTLDHILDLERGSKPRHCLVTVLQKLGFTSDDPITELKIAEAALPHNDASLRIGRLFSTTHGNRER